MKRTFPYMSLHTIISWVAAPEREYEISYKSMTFANATNYNSPISLLMSRFLFSTMRSVYSAATIANGWHTKEHSYFFSYYISVWHAKCLIFQHLLCKFIITLNIFICVATVKVSPVRGHVSTHVKVKWRNME